MTAHVYAIGDSVMQGAGPDLYGTLTKSWPGIEVDAAPNRQLWHAPDIVRARLKTGPQLSVLVIHLGTNGLFNDTTLDDLVTSAGETSSLLFVTIRAPREWETAVNERLRRGVERHAPQSVILDWHAVAGRHPAHLRPDGFHLSASGAVAYATTIASALRREQAKVSRDGFLPRTTRDRT